MNHFVKSALRLAAMLIAVSLVAGCASFGGGGTPEERVARLAAERWQAVLAGDAQKAYGYLAPSYREVFSFERYQAYFGSAVRRESADVVRIECEEELCRVTVRVEFRHPTRARMGLLNTHMLENWVLEDGRWWYYRRR